MEKTYQNAFGYQRRWWWCGGKMCVSVSQEKELSSYAKEVRVTAVSVSCCCCSAETWSSGATSGPVSAAVVMRPPGGRHNSIIAPPSQRLSSAFLRTTIADPCRPTRTIRSQHHSFKSRPGQPASPPIVRNIRGVMLLPTPTQPRCTEIDRHPNLPSHARNDKMSFA